MNGGLHQYNVYVSVNGSTFTLLATSMTTGYIHHILNNSADTYCYIVRAVNSAGTITSSSNKACIIAKNPAQPTYIYLKRVSINPNQTADVDYIIDNTSSIKGVNLFVSEKATGPFKPLAYLPYTGVANYSYNDVAVFPSSGNYYYQAQVMDSCGHSSLVSNTSKTILLKVSAVSEFINTLNWDDYTLFLGNVQEYNIYRAINGVFDPVPIATLPFGRTTFSDDVSEFVAEKGKFSYYVEAVEGAGNPYALNERSASNIVDAYQQEDIFVPNAFAPRGENTVFLPITQYVDKSAYHFMIFNRFGQKIWETNNDYTAWDGANCEGAVYVYLITYKNATGEYEEYRGTVTLIR